MRLRPHVDALARAIVDGRARLDRRPLRALVRAVGAAADDASKNPPVGPSPTPLGEHRGAVVIAWPPHSRSRAVAGLVQAATRL
jgi:hypothetical protein